MSLEKEITEVEFLPGESDVLDDQFKSLNRQLEYLTRLYQFAEAYEQTTEAPDRLHRLLFQETNFTSRSFKNRMTRAAKNIETTSKMLESSGITQKGVEEFIESVELPSITEDTDTIAELSGLDSDGLRAVEESIARFQPELDEIQSVLSAEKGDLLITASERLRKYKTAYESRLAEEGFIDRDGGTPSLLSIIAGCIILVCAGTVIIATVMGEAVDDRAMQFIRALVWIAMFILAT